MDFKTDGKLPSLDSIKDQLGNVLSGAGITARTALSLADKIIGKLEALEDPSDKQAKILKDFGPGTKANLGMGVVKDIIDALLLGRGAIRND